MKPIVDKTVMENALLNLLRIRSVKTQPKEDAPFGEGVRDALTYTLSLAKDLGFETINYDNYIGEVIFGEGEPFGVLCHLDVVPEGSLDDWNTPPYEPTVIDGKLYARGALDDKSGAITTLFAMKAIKDAGITPKRQIRLILGCDEESGWGCIDYYTKHATLPEEGISPDADFPVIYAEKGIVHIQYSFSKSENLLSVRGGERANVVCDYAVAKVEKMPLWVDYHHLELGNDVIESYGVSAHGSTPEKGKNAIDRLLEVLCDGGLVQKEAHDRLFKDSLKLKELCDETGHLTFSPNVIFSRDDKIYVTVDVRYPATLDKDYVLTRLAQVGDYEILSYQRPLFSEKDSGLVKTLTDIYARITGDKTPPMAIGGGTYARALKKGVAFGPARGEEGDSIHKPNEYVTLETLSLMTEIYLETLLEICC